MKKYIGEFVLGEDGDRCTLKVATNEQEYTSALHSDRAAVDLSLQAISLPVWACLAGVAVSLHKGLGGSLACFAAGCVLMVLVAGLGYVRQSLVTRALVTVVLTERACTKFNRPTNVLLAVCLLLWALGVAAFAVGVWAAV